MVMVLAVLLVLVLQQLPWLLLQPYRAALLALLMPRGKPADRQLADCNLKLALPTAPLFRVLLTPLVLLLLFVQLETLHLKTPSMTQ